MCTMETTHPTDYVAKVTPSTTPTCPLCCLRDSPLRKRSLQANYSPTRAVKWRGLQAYCQDRKTFRTRTLPVVSSQGCLTESGDTSPLLHTRVTLTTVCWVLGVEVIPPQACTVRCAPFFQLVCWLTIDELLMFHRVLKKELQLCRFAV